MNPVELLKKNIITDESKAALIYSGVNRRYLTHFPSSDGVLLLTAKDAYLLLDFRYAEAGANKAQNCKVVEITNFGDTLTEIVKNDGVSEVYFEMEGISLAQAKRYEAVLEKAGAKAMLDKTLDTALSKQRMIKTPGEIAGIEAAQKITDDAFAHILPFIKEGVTEREVALEIEFFMKKNGADDLAFDSIVVSGVNSSLPHGVPSDKKIEVGDFITMDTGAMVNGLHSDMTRTVALGKITDEQKKVYETVLAAHMAVIELTKPGMPGSEVDKIARDIIDRDYAGRFGHGLGHGVGYEIHEEPRFSKLDPTPCEAGMVITNEPGIYLPGKFGVRIEDMLLITSTGCRSLTHSPKELIVL